MDKKLFQLDAADFNRVMDICATNSKKPVVQIVAGQVMWCRQAERLTMFWESICVKYGFDPGTVEVNILNKDATYFLATEVSRDDRLVNYCTLCNSLSGPDIESGCDRANEKGCAWYVKK